MQLLDRWKVGRRLALGYGLMVALMLLMAGAIQRQISAVDHAKNVLLSEQAERLALVEEWRANIMVNSQRAMGIGLTGHEELAQYWADAMKASSKRTSEIQKRYQALETTHEGKALQARLAEVRKRYLAQREALMKVGDDVEARHRLSAEFGKTVDDYIAEAGEMVAFQVRRRDALGADIAQSVKAAQVSLLLVTLISTVTAVGLAWLVTRSLTRPLSVLQTSARRIAQGDLSCDVPPAVGRSEMALLSEDVSLMQEALRRLVGQARTATDSIEVASREVAAGNADLSTRTEQAASSLQETASSMEQLTSTVTHTAEAAVTANELASSAAHVAERGGRVMHDVVRTMDGIQNASSRIADIIGVIDGIAFQTNILALNAAVESARAGEQGRGFAVVAGEVRTLAQRSATAAREIKDLIGASVEQVSAGSRLVGDAGQTIREIVTSVEQVRQIIGEISVAANEQSQGLSEVNTAVSQLDQMTQQNAALVEESAAAADSLRQQASRLAEVISGFKLAVMA